MTQEIERIRAALKANSAPGYIEQFAYAFNHDGLPAVLAHIDQQAREIDRLRDAMHVLLDWSEAYPLSIFPEPDFKKAHEILTRYGMTLDAISASNMRHVITQVRTIIDASMKEQA